MKILLIALITASILLSNKAQGQTKEEIINFEEAGASHSKTISMGPHGFALVVTNTSANGSRDKENTIYRYSNSLKLLWQTNLPSDDMNFSSNFSFSPNGETIYIIKYYDNSIIMLDEKGNVTRGTATTPKKMTKYFTFADNDHLNIVYKYTKQSYKHSTKEKEALHWVTIDHKMTEKSKEFFLPIPENMTGKYDYWSPYTFIDGIAYLKRTCSPKNEDSYTEFLMVNKEEEVNFFKIMDPKQIADKTNTSYTDKQIQFNAYSKKIYVRYIIEDGAKFQIKCLDVNGKEIWDNRYNFKAKLKLKGVTNRRYNHMRTLNNGIYAYQMVQPWGDGGAQTYFFSEETGELLYESHIEYKVKATEKTENLISLNNSLIYFYPKGEAKNMLAEKSKSFEKKKDLKVSKYFYFTTETGEIIAFMINKKLGGVPSLTSIEMYYYKH